MRDRTVSANAAQAESRRAEKAIAYKVPKAGLDSTPPLSSAAALHKERGLADWIPPRSNHCWLPLEPLVNFWPFLVSETQRPLIFTRADLFWSVIELKAIESVGQGRSPGSCS